MTRTPGTDDQRSFRDLMGTFATGVVVVTATHDGQRHAMAVNSFASVSLEPPMVSFCAAHTSSTWPHIRAAGRFGVSILEEGHEALARACAAPGVDRFRDARTLGAWDETDGVPTVAGGLASLECTVAQILPAGDHDIVVGEVVGMSAVGDGRPLVFFRGNFERMAR